MARWPILSDPAALVRIRGWRCLFERRLAVRAPPRCSSRNIATGVPTGDVPGGTSRVKRARFAFQSLSCDES